MKIKKTITKKVYGVKITAVDGGKAVGRSYVYILHNDLHKRPFALLEDVFVSESLRGQGLGSQLIKLAIAEAKKRRCYKIIATSRSSRPALHKFYERFGFKLYGVELRKDFR